MPEERYDIRPMTRRDLELAARWHSEEFPDGFYPRLGSRFLAAYYRTFLTSPYAVALVTVAGGRITGYVAGTFDERRHGRWVLLRYCVLLVAVGTLCLLLRPWLWRDFVRCRAIRYLRRLVRAVLEAITPQRTVAAGELAYIVTAQEARGQGVGACLLNEFRDRASRAGTRELRLVTAADAPRLSSFYQRASGCRCRRSTIRSVVTSRSVTDRGSTGPWPPSLLRSRRSRPPARLRPRPLTHRRPRRARSQL
jgi:ribosomal protein S18 acetylase RimI-like enzyme